MKYYMVGIKKGGMSALALLLSDLGYDIIGYDDSKDVTDCEEKLIEHGIKVYSEPNNEMDDETMVIYHPSLKVDENSELIKAKKLNLKIYEYQEIIDRLIKKFDTIYVCGAHGKTTTASMLSKAMLDIEGCNYLIECLDGHGDINSNRLILKTSKYLNSYLEYNPEYIIITNIEMDYNDYSKSMDDIIFSYQDFANKASKMVIACGDDPYTHSLEVNPQIYYYGLSEDNDIQARNVEYTNDGTSFDVFVEDEYYGHFDLPIFGKHMVLDALAAMAICHYERLEAKEIGKILKEFQSDKENDEEIISENNTLISKKVFYPVEIRTTIKAYRQKHSEKSIIAIFEPSTFSSVKMLSDEFVNALNLADKAYIMDINCEVENEEEYSDINSYTIIDKLDSGDYIDENNASKLLEYENSVLLFMGNVKIYSLKDKYKKLLEQKNN